MTDSADLTGLFDQSLSERQRTFLECVLTQPSIEKALRAAHVGERTYAEWRTKEPAFEQALRVARAIVLDRRIDHMHIVAATEPDVQRAKVIIDTDKWLAAKLIPKVYGDRIDVNVSGHIDIGSALEEAKARVVRPMRDLLPIIDAQVVDSRDSIGAEPIDNESTPPVPDIFS